MYTYCMKYHNLEINSFVWIKIFSIGLQNSILFSQLYTRWMWKSTGIFYWIFRAWGKITWFWSFRIYGNYWLLISFLWLARPSDCGLKNHLAPAQDRLKTTTHYNPNKVHEKHFAVPISVYHMVHPSVPTGPLQNEAWFIFHTMGLRIFLVLCHNGVVGFY